MKIGIISDTHDNVPNILNAVDKFKQHKVDFVIHAGDVVAPGTIKYFSELKTRFVYGNCDGDRTHLKLAVQQIGGEHFGDIMELEINGKKIIVMHKPEYQLMLEKYDYIIHGHIHEIVDKTQKNSRILCPGGHYLGDSPEVNNIIILEPEKDSVEFIQIG